MRNLVLAIVISASVITAIALLSGAKGIYSVMIFNPDLLLFSAGFSLLLFALDAFRLKVMLKLIGKDLKFHACFRNVIVCSFFSLTTPFSIGGQAAQVYDLTKSGVSGTEATSVVLSRSLISMFASTGAGLIFMHHVVRATSLQMMRIPIFLGFTVSASLTTLIAFALFRMDISEKILRNILRILPRKLRDKALKGFQKTVEELKSGVRNLWVDNKAAVFVDLVIWTIYMLAQPLSLYVPLKALCDFPVRYWTMVGMYIILNITAFYTPTPGASGGIESVFYFSLSPYADRDCLLKSILIWRIGSYYFPLIIGAFYSWRSMRERSVDRV